ncbi:MAG: hypothetical protein LUF30_09495, partial [Lachnospiraceae bacterium]|nr:hypothetical protein [Lachnospiraceae bacterium]
PSGNVSRVQTLMQMGQQKTNIAYLSDHTSDTSFNGSTAFQTLLDSGLTYTPLTHGELESEYVTLNEDGTVSNLGIQVILLNNVETTTVAAMEKLAEFAENGILIINTSAATSGGGSDPMMMGGEEAEAETEAETEAEEAAVVYPCKVIGTDTDGSSALAIAEALDRIMASGNYVECTNQEAIVEAVLNHCTPRISYSISSLQMTEAYDESDGANYFILYNAGDEDITDGELTITATGSLYCLDPAYGSVTKLTDGTEYTANGDGSATVTGLSLQAG